MKTAQTNICSTTRVFLAVSLLSIIALYASPSAHAADWKVGLTVTVPYAMGERDRATQLLTAGVRPTAQDAFDNSSDTISLGSSILAAYFYHPENNGREQFLARDFRADHYPQSWSIYVSSDQDGQPITLSWGLPAGTPGSCQELSLSLTDVTAGVTVDLLQSSYVYTNKAAPPRQFALTATPASESPPSAPLNLFSPRTGTASVLLAWSGANDSSVVGYYVYRKDPGATEYRRVTATPIAVAKYLDNSLNPGAYSYLVTAVTSTGCESSPSNALSVTVGP